MSRSKANGSMFSNRSRSISRLGSVEGFDRSKEFPGTALPRIGQTGCQRFEILLTPLSQTVSLPVPLNEFAIQKTLEPSVKKAFDDGFLPHLGMTERKVTPPRQQIRTAGVGFDLNDLEDFAHALLEVDSTFRRPKLGREQILARRRDCPLSVTLFDQIIAFGDDSRVPRIARVEPVP